MLRLIKRVGRYAGLDIFRANSEDFRWSPTVEELPCRAGGTMAQRKNARRDSKKMPAETSRISFRRSLRCGIVTHRDLVE